MNDIERYPQAFVLGCLANRMGKAKQAWKVPLRLRERFGTLDVAALAQKTGADWVRVTRDPTTIHRRPELMAKVLRLGVRRLQDSHDGDAAWIWEGSPPSATVVRRFVVQRPCHPGTRRRRESSAWAARASGRAAGNLRALRDGGAALDWPGE